MRGPGRAGEGGLRRAQIAAALAVLGIGLVLAVVALARTQPRLAGTNNVAPQRVVATLTPGRTACQKRVLIPADTAAVRVAVRAPASTPSPALRLTLAVAGEPLRVGNSSAGYAVPASAAIPIPRVRSTVVGMLCLRVDRGRVALAGAPAPGAANALAVGGRVRPAALSIELLRSGRESLLSMLPVAFHRATLFRPGWVGPWTYYVLAALVLALTVAAPVLLIAWRPRTRLALALLAVGLLGFLNACAWSLATPTFEAPDEVVHYAYVESLAQRGKIPSQRAVPGETPYDRETELVLRRTAANVWQKPAARPPWTERQEADLRRAIAALGPFAQAGGGGRSGASAYAPAYYGLAVVPYLAAGGASTFTHVWLIRLLSALMVAGAVVFAFLLARELAPGTWWLAPVTALAVAFEPMFAFIGGAVNNDNLLVLLATAEVYVLARALRRGLDARLALAAGTALGLGIWAKPQMYALVPVAALAIGWTLWRQRPDLRGAAIQVGAAALPLLALVVLRYVVSGVPLFSESSGIEGIKGVTLAKTGASGTFAPGQFLSYLWQWFLPPLPFMTDWFGRLGGRPVYHVFLQGFWGDFGYLDTRFPDAVYVLLALASAGVVGLDGVALHRLRSRLPELWPRIALLVLTALSTGLLVILRSYLARIADQVPQLFAQGRYLMAAVGVFGFAVAAAGLAFGRRRGLVAGTVAVAAIAVLNAFSLGLVIVRFYV